MTGKRAAGRTGAQPTILLDLFVAFQRSAQAVELSFAEHGLDVPDFAILSTIGVESPVTATTLAQRLGISQRTMLFRVRRLVEQGLVARVRSESDRRAVELSLGGPVSVTRGKDGTLYVAQLSDSIAVGSLDQAPGRLVRVSR